MYRPRRRPVSACRLGKMIIPRSTTTVKGIRPFVTLFKYLRAPRSARRPRAWERALRDLGSVRFHMPKGPATAQLAQVPPATSGLRTFSLLQCPLCRCPGCVRHERVPVAPKTGQARRAAEEPLPRRLTVTPAPRTLSPPGRPWAARPPARSCAPGSRPRRRRRTPRSRS